MTERASIERPGAVSRGDMSRLSPRHSGTEFHDLPNTGGAASDDARAPIGIPRGGIPSHRNPSHNRDLPAGALRRGKISAKGRATLGPPSPKQELFCVEYLKDLNATQAAIRAGFSPKTATAKGSYLLANPAVSARIAALMAERRQRTELDTDWVIRELIEVVERCMQSTPVLDRSGQPVLMAMPNGTWVPGYEFDALGATRALALLGRHLGLFSADRRRRETELSVEELRRLADERQANDPRYAWMKTLDTEIDELREEWKPPEPAARDVAGNTEADAGMPAPEDFEEEEE